ncbi:MAG: hypothetical protein AAFV53_00540 [Myxococcota bacterium]
MSWFQRQGMGNNEREIAANQGRYLRAAGVDAALGALAGPFGVRRFAVRFAARNGRVQIQAIEAMPLRDGGGPPPPDPRKKHQDALAAALTKLWKNMQVGPRWSRGVIGYLRDRTDAVQIHPLFDEDADVATLERLPMPLGGGHPLESPAYQSMRNNNEHHMTRLMSRTAMIGGDWDVWELDGGQLRLHLDQEVRRHRCQVLGVLEVDPGRFTWVVDNPLFGEPDVFTEPNFSADWNAANELGLLTAARLEADWLFVGDLEDGRVLFAAVY